MNTLIRLVVASLLIACAMADCPDVATVDINTTSYLGVWYEISVSPLARDTFEIDCCCTHANYTVRSAGVLNVDNTCNDNTVDGPVAVAHGTAVQTNASAPGKLEVSFGGPAGPYWIILLEPNYEWVVVWSCTTILGLDAEIMWVLSRTPTMSNSTYQMITSKAQTLTGYNIDHLRMTAQRSEEHTSELQSPA